MQHHADLLSKSYWQARKQRIMDGHIEDVFPYPQHIRFCHQSQTTTPALHTPPYLENYLNE
jgi:isocitrate dehydrogenase kinase/phosphatase